MLGLREDEAHQLLDLTANMCNDHRRRGCRNCSRRERRV